MRAFALYVEVHYLYLKQEYAISAGIVEAMRKLDIKTRKGLKQYMLR